MGAPILSLPCEPNNRRLYLQFLYPWSAQPTLLTHKPLPPTDQNRPTRFLHQARGSIAAQRSRTEDKSSKLYCKPPNLVIANVLVSRAARPLITRVQLMVILREAFCICWHPGSLGGNRNIRVPTGCRSCCHQIEVA